MPPVLGKGDSDRNGPDSHIDAPQDDQKTRWTPDLLMSAGSEPFGPSGGLAFGDGEAAAGTQLAAAHRLGQRKGHQGSRPAANAVDRQAGQAGMKPASIGQRVERVESQDYLQGPLFP